MNLFLFQDKQQGWWIETSNQTEAKTRRIRGFRVYITFDDAVKENVGLRGAFEGDNSAPKPTPSASSDRRLTTSPWAASPLVLWSHNADLRKKNLPWPIINKNEAKWRAKVIAYAGDDASVSGWEVITPTNSTLLFEAWASAPPCGYITWTKFMILSRISFIHLASSG
jgi:hypothetical protein